MSLTADCQTITVTSSQGSKVFNKEITSLDLRNEKVYMTEHSATFPTIFSWNLAAAIAEGYASLQELYNFLLTSLNDRCGGNGGGGGGTTSHNLTIIGNGTNSYQNNNLIGATYVFGSIDSQIIMPSTVVLDNSTGTLTFTNNVQTDAIIQIIFNK